MEHNSQEIRKTNVIPKPEGAKKTSYSDLELLEFKKLIIGKLEKARQDEAEMNSLIRSLNENGTDDTARSFKFLEEGNDAVAKEEAGQMANRQRRFIQQLESALHRIETKSYGICSITGNLIPKDRLKIVPHTTHCIEAKMKL